MARRVTAIVLGMAAAGAAAVAVMRQIPHPDRDPAATSVALMTALAVLVAVGLIALRRSIGRRPDPVRVSLACTAGLIAFLAIVGGCDDIGGVPDWERCTSYLGTPTLDWSRPWVAVTVFGPLLLSAAVGLLAWWLVGPPPGDSEDARPVSRT
jgi:hypothetical protein